MRWFLLVLLLAIPATGAERLAPFADPITGFSEALLPVLTGFEKACVETTLRGFIARGDSRPGYKQSDITPSEDGIYLNVAVRDASEVTGLSDHSEQKGAVTHRIVQIPPAKGGDQALVILLNYGRNAPKEVIGAIDKSIRGIIDFSNRETKP